jgi:hypothetical protein
MAKVWSLRGQTGVKTRANSNFGPSSCAARRGPSLSVISPPATSRDMPKLMPTLHLRLDRQRVDGQPQATATVARWIRGLGEKMPSQTRTRSWLRSHAGIRLAHRGDSTMRGNPVEIRHGVTFQQPQAAVSQVNRWCNPPTRGMATTLDLAAFLRSMGLGVGASLSSESWMRSSHYLRILYCAVGRALVGRKNL